MAENCRHWKNGKCVAPGFDIGNDCNWPDSDYNGCFVYRASGGTTKDALRAMGATPPSEGGFSFPTHSPEKKWWQFWK